MTNGRFNDKSFLISNAHLLYTHFGCLKKFFIHFFIILSSKHFKNQMQQTGKKPNERNLIKMIFDCHAPIISGKKCTKKHLNKFAKEIFSITLR